MTKEKILKFSIAGFLLAGLVFILGNASWFPDFYAPKLFGIFSFISAFFIILPKFLFRSKPDELGMKKESLINFQIALAISLILNGFGSLGLFQLYKVGFEYDKMVHFITGLIMTIAFSRLLFYRYEFSFTKAVFLSAFLMLVAGALWEIFEFLSDFILGTKTLGVYGAQIKKDTILDLVFDFLGIVAGILVLSRRHLTRKNGSI